MLKQENKTSFSLSVHLFSYSSYSFILVSYVSSCIFAFFNVLHMHSLKMFSYSLLSCTTYNRDNPVVTLLD